MWLAILVEVDVWPCSFHIVTHWRCWSIQIQCIESMLVSSFFLISLEIGLRQVWLHRLHHCLIFSWETASFTGRSTSVLTSWTFLVHMMFLHEFFASRTQFFDKALIGSVCELRAHLSSLLFNDLIKVTFEPGVRNLLLLNGDALDSRATFLLIHLNGALIILISNFTFFRVPHRW